MSRAATIWFGRKAGEERSEAMEAVKAGGRVNDNLSFTPLRVAVLTVSDSRSLDEDVSGAVLAERIQSAGHHLAERGLVKDDVEAIRSQLLDWIERGIVDAIITTGGTGFAGRDVTPEAVEPLFSKRIDGFTTIFHLVSYESVGLSTLLSRATAGLVRDVLVFCLPGSTGAVRDGWDKVIRDLLDSRHRPCNLADLRPRFGEA